MSIERMLQPAALVHFADSVLIKAFSCESFKSKTLLKMTEKEWQASKSGFDVRKG